MDECEHEPFDRGAADPSRWCPCNKGLLPRRASRIVHLICSNCEIAVRSRIRWKLTHSWNGKLVGWREDFEQQFYMDRLMESGVFEKLLETFNPRRGSFTAFLAGVADSYCDSKARSILRELNRVDYSAVPEAPLREQCMVTIIFARHVVGESLERTRERWRTRTPSFETLKRFLIGPKPDRARVAADLSKSRNTLDQTIKRLRAVWSEELRRLVGATLEQRGTPDEREARISAEILLLLRIFEQHAPSNG